jgi:hypothetical protein
MFPLSPTTSRGSRTTSPLRETVMRKQKPNKRPTQTRNDARSQILRWERKRIWKRRTYGSASSKRVAVPNFIPVTSDLLRSRRRSQRRPITPSNCQQSTRYTPKSTPVASNELTRMTQLYSPDESLPNRLPSMPTTINPLLRPSWITAPPAGKDNSWFIGRDIQI